MRTADDRSRERSALRWQLGGVTLGMAVVLVVDLFTDFPSHSWLWFTWGVCGMYGLPLAGLLAIRWYNRHTIVDQHQRLLVGVLQLALLSATIGFGLAALPTETIPGAAVLYMVGLTLMSATNMYVADRGHAIKLVLRALRP